MTTLQKLDGAVRGIATGGSFQRLVAKTLDRQFGKAVETTTAPHQFTLPTRDGTDCVGHAFRSLTEPATVLSIDGIGVYDHARRSVMMAKLLGVPSLRGLLPLSAQRTLAQQATLGRMKRVQRQIRQADEGEQEDLLMLLLLSLAIHDVLKEVDSHLEANKSLIAFLDGVHVVTLPKRTNPVCISLGQHQHTMVGIQFQSWQNSHLEWCWPLPSGSREGWCGVLESGRHQNIGDFRGGKPFRAGSVGQEGSEMRRKHWEVAQWIHDLQSSGSHNGRASGRSSRRAQS